MPLGTYTAPRRLTGRAAVSRVAWRAGTIPSSSGSATLAPSPRSTVRRDRCFFVMTIRHSSLRACGRAAAATGPPAARIQGLEHHGATAAVAASCCAFLI